VGRSQETHHHPPSGLQTLRRDAHGLAHGTSRPTPSPQNPNEPNLQPIEHHQSDPQIDRDQPPRTDAAIDSSNASIPDHVNFFLRQSTMKRQRTNTGNNAMRAYRNVAPIPRNNTRANLHAGLTGPQRTLAVAIVRGDLDAVRQLAIRPTYYDTPFDTTQHKLVAFAMHHALRDPVNTDRVLIVHHLINAMPKNLKGHGLSTAIKGTRNHSVAHVAGTHATTINDFNRMRHKNVANTSQGFLVPNFNKYAKKKNARGKNASQYSRYPAARNHIKGVIDGRTRPASRMNTDDLVAGLRRM
jgi:hypothetical protein